MALILYIDFENGDLKTFEEGESSENLDGFTLTEEDMVQLVDEGTAALIKVEINQLHRPQLRQAVVGSESSDPSEQSKKGIIDWKLLG